ncbi:unnamed protein product, partial [Allacma fusca]
MYLYAFTLIDMIFTSAEILTELQFGKKDYKTVGYLRTEQEFIKVYRQTQCFQILCGLVASPIALPFHKWLFLMSCVYCIYGSIKSQGIFAFALFIGALIFMAVLILVYSLLSKIPSGSEE